MDELSVPANIKGYSYLRTAIMMTVNEPKMICDGTGKLYTALAEQYRVSQNSVESAIRHAIKITWDRGDVDIMNAYFGCTIENWRGKPTASEFIAIIADDIRLQSKNDALKNQAKIK